MLAADDGIKKTLNDKIQELQAAIAGM